MELTKVVVGKIRRAYARGQSCYEIAKRMGISENLVRMIVRL